MASLLPAVRAARRTVSTILLLAYLPACSSWHVGTPTPARFVEQEHPDAVRVTRVDGSTVMLHAPTVRGDSLIGRTRAGLAREDTTATLGIALADIRQVEVRRTSTTTTLLLVGVVLVAVVVIGACAASDENQFYDPC